jgi:hypothetical protein
LATAFRAFAANFGASRHKISGFFRKTLALFSARFADIGARAANLRVKIRHSNHKIRARLATLNAVLKQFDMTGCGVFSAHLQAMRDCFKTNGVTVLTIFDAGLHLLIHFFVVHIFTFPYFSNFRFVAKPRRIRVELFLTRGRTKIKGSSLIIGLPGGIRFFDLHTANRVCLFIHLKTSFFK